MKKIIVIALMGLLSVAAMAQTKFAHVYFEELVQLTPEADEARNKMRAANKEAQETGQAMIEEFQNKYAQYQQKAASWTPAIKESKEKELTEMQQRIQEFDQSIQQELQQQQQTLFAPIHKKVQDTVNEIAKKAGYIYVFGALTLFYIDPAQSVDITPEARKMLGIKEGRTLETLQKEIQEYAQQEQAAAAAATSAK